MHNYMQHRLLNPITIRDSKKTQEIPTVTSQFGYELLRVCSPRGNFVDHVFLKAQHLTSFLKHVSPLAVGVFGCYSLLITLTLKLKKNKYVIKAVKVVLEQFKLAKQSCNMQEQLFPYRY